ncbi:MAG: DNA-directed RNA polymerase subunit alpha [Helicobacter sp.]|nr:DNA-directed RNA polymerase subunit alpha [Helicobacter sp.]
MKTIKIAPYIPTNVDVEDLGNNRVKISAYPFESGYAITLAHPLRRLLMSSSVGFAPIAIKIQGVAHEFDSIRGIVEDVSPFIVNLKNIRFLANEENVSIDYSFKGPLVLKASHLENDKINVINKDSALATINEDTTLDFSLIVQKGIGYVPSEDIRDLIPEGYIPLDAYFTPVRNVIYNIENVLVDDNPNYEKIIFDVQTDGQISPYDAFKHAISILESQMSVFNNKIHSPKVIKAPCVDDTCIKNLLLKIEHINLPQRCLNSLDKIGIIYLGELALMSENEIKNIKNLGAKSYEDLAQKYEEYLGQPIGSELDAEKKSLFIKKLSTLKSQH